MNLQSFRLPAFPADRIPAKQYLCAMKQKNKALPYLLLGLALIALLLVKNRRLLTPEKHYPRQERREPGRSSDPTQPGNGRDNSLDAFNRHPAQLNYSKHARCRMGCRHIDAAEVTEMLEQGTVNPAKSDMRATPDPRYAIEGRTHDGQQVRIIVAQNGRVSTIVTVIDLDTHWTCDCPGD
jgi:hypothetical protein